MKHRLVFIATVLVFLTTLGFGLFSSPGHVSAATDYYYTNDKFDGIQGPNPFRVADQSVNVTYEKASSEWGKGIYINRGSPVTSNGGGFCYPAVQTNDKKYEGDTSAKVYLECGSPGHSNPKNPKSITVSKTRPIESGGGVNTAQRQVFDYELCPALKSLDKDLFNQTCNLDYANQSDQDAAVKKMCDKYGGNQLQQQCDDYRNKTFNQDNAPDDNQPSCEASGFSLSWIFCPIINGLADATDQIYSSLVQPLLETKPINLSDPAGDPTHTFEIWSNFRVYGNIFLVLALLVVVFGESISGGLIDAYTAKKILPRLLLAAILINISIYIVAFAVDITNIIGNGIANLIQAPFQNAGDFKLHIDGATGDIGMAALVGGGIWAVASLAPLIEFLLLFFLIPAFLTFIAILVTVLLRQGLIIFLILISPVAFALYCLPNTEQYFRKWWELLFKTLLIYPLIAVMFALANVLSVTINSTTSGITATFGDFISIIALFVPLFLIPYSFRLAGGVLGKFHDFATSTRQRSQEAIKGNANNPDSWRNRTRAKLSQRQSEIGMDGKAIGDNIKAVPGSKTWRENRQARIGAARKLKGEAFLESDSVAKALKGNDQYLLAVANPKLASQQRDKAVADGDEAGATSWNQAIASARLGPKTPAIRMAAALQHASTGFQYAPGQQGYNQLAETMSDITGAELDRDGAGNVKGALPGPRAGAFADAMDNAQFAEKGAGRWDMAGINRGAGYSYRDGIKKGSGYTAGQGKPDTYIAGAPEYLKVPLQNGKTPDIPVLTQQIRDNVSSGRATSDDVAKWHDVLLASAGNPAFGNGDEINKQMKAIEDAARTSGAGTNAPPQLLDLQTKLQDNMKRQRRGLDPNLLDNDK